MPKKAVILLSGGVDSATCLAIAQEQGFSCYALSLDYGQKHNIELDSARRIARALGAVEYKQLSIPALGDLGGSALTDTNIAVPDYQASDLIPNTYVPARNTIFLSLALAWAEVLGAYDIFYGANALDYSNYADCRPDYLAAFQKLADLATKAGVEGGHFTIHAPLISWHKSEIIREGLRLGVDFALTISCYRANPKGEACGRCDSCTFRREGFKAAGVADATRYVSTVD